MTRSRLATPCLALARWSHGRSVLASASPIRYLRRQCSSAPFISDDATVRVQLPSYDPQVITDTGRSVGTIPLVHGAVRRTQIVDDVQSLREEIQALVDNPLVDVSAVSSILERCIDSSLNARTIDKQELIRLLGSWIRTQASSTNPVSLYVPLIRQLLKWSIEDENVRHKAVCEYIEYWKECTGALETDLLRPLLYNARPEEVTQLSEMYTKQQKVLSPSLAYLLLQRLARTEDIRSMWRLFDYIRQSGVRREKRLYNTLITALVRANDKQGAFTVVKIMLNDHLKPDITTFNALLSGFAQKDNVHGAHSVLDMMRESGVPTDSATHGYLLSLYLRTGHTDRAIRLVERMTGKGNEQLTIAQYNSIVSRLLRDNEISKAIRVVTRHTDLSGPMDLISYNLQLRVWVRAQRPDKAQKLFAYMRRNGGVGVDNVSYSTMMDMYVKLGRAAETLELWHDLRQPGKIEPDLVTCNCVLMAKAQIEGSTSALEFLDELRRMGHVPDATSFNVVLSTASRARDLDSAMHVWERMKKENINYTGASYVAMASVLAQRKGASACSKFLKEHTKYSPPICSLVLKRLVELDDPEAFGALWDVLWAPAMDARVLRAGLKGASQFKMHSRVEQILGFLEQRPEKLRGTLSALLDTLETAGAYESRIMSLLTDHLTHLSSVEWTRLLKVRRGHVPLSLVMYAHRLARDSESGLEGALATELASAFMSLRHTNGLKDLVEDVEHGRADLGDDICMSIVRAFEENNDCLNAICAATVLSSRECLTPTADMMSSLAESAILSADAVACFLKLPLLSRSVQDSHVNKGLYHAAALRAANESKAESVLCFVRYLQNINVELDQVYMDAILSAHTRLCGANAENVDIAIEELLKLTPEIPRECAPHLPLSRAYETVKEESQESTPPLHIDATHETLSVSDSDNVQLMGHDVTDTRLIEAFTRIESKLEALEAEMKRLRQQHAELLDTYHKRTRRKL